jgi:hypothetical protein
MALIEGDTGLTGASATKAVKVNASTGALLTELAAGTGGTSDALEATQLLVKTAVQNLDTATGAVTASPTANTLLARLKDILSLTVLAAGTNLIGKVGIDQTTPGTTDSVTVKSGTVKVTASTTRPAEHATAYTAGDVLGVALDTTTSAITFTGIGPIGKVIRITGTRLEIDVTAIPTGMTSFRLHLYNATPATVYYDNAAWDLPDNDRAKYLGYVDLGTPVDLGSTLYVQQTGLDYDFLMGASANLFGYLVTNGGFTPSDSTVKSITLYAMAM